VRETIVRAKRETRSAAGGLGWRQPNRGALMTRTSSRLAALAALAALLAAAPACRTPESPAPAAPGTTEPAISAAALADTPAIALSASIPGDAAFAAPFDLPGLQKDFDIFSWNSFIALNWPPGPGGAGDPAKTIGARGDNPTVWELYADVGAIFLPAGATPTPDDPPTPVPPACQALAAAGEKILTQVGKTPTVLTDMSQPFNTGPLPDQNGVYTRFEIAVNQSMYDYIVFNALYSKAGQKAFTGPVKFPCGSLPSNGSIGVEGAIMVKSAWKVIDPAERGHFHIATALVYSPASSNPSYPAKCERQTVGLVGMHIVHKTNSAAQWVWSTFEHIDNAPTEAEVASGKLEAKYNFYDPKCSAADCPPNEVPPRPWDPTRNSAFHTQVVRLDSFQGNEFAPESAAARNAEAHALLAGVNPRSVWLNYELISTQWPTATGDCAALPGNPVGTPAPNFLANITLETYVQGMTPLASSSCMQCHNNATMTTPVPSDFTYVLQRAQ
jgi:hypothetical protein